MFRGNHPAKIDDKGRLKLPSAFKDQLDAQHVTRFYVTSEDGQFAEVWPLQEWEKWEAVLVKRSMNPAVKKYLSLTSYYGQEVDMDSQARVLMPQTLREEAKLDAEVAVIGNANHLEVHNKGQFKQGLAANPMNDQDRAVMAEIQSSLG